MGGGWNFQYFTWIFIPIPEYEVDFGHWSFYADFYVCGNPTHFTTDHFRSSNIISCRLVGRGAHCRGSAYPEHCSSCKISAGKGMSTCLDSTEEHLFTPSTTLVFQKRLRNLTPEEVDEFLRGNPPASDVAPDGGEKALALPFTHTLAPDSLIVGRCSPSDAIKMGIQRLVLWVQHEKRLLGLENSA